MQQKYSPKVALFLVQSLKTGCSEKRIRSVDLSVGPMLGMNQTNALCLFTESGIQRMKHMVQP